MAEENETIEDIVGDIRAQNQGLPEDATALSPLVCDILNLADRLDAARKRERGDCAKLREAVKAVVDVGYPHNFQREAPHIRGYCYDITRAIEKCFAALAAPPRNCDKYPTFNDAIRALADKRGWHDEKWDSERYCILASWLYAPATEQEGGAK